MNSRFVISALIAPLAFLGADFEMAPAVRSRTRDRREEERREEVSRRGRQWFVPTLVTSAIASGDDVAPTRHDDEFKLVLKFLPRREAFAECKKLGLWPNVDTVERLPRGFNAGCNAFYPDTKTCVVITPEPREVDDDATRNLGHEVLHCARGAYHD